MPSTSNRSSLLASNASHKSLIVTARSIAAIVISLPYLAILLHIWKWQYNSRYNVDILALLLIRCIPENMLTMFFIIFWRNAICCSYVANKKMKSGGSHNKKKYGLTAPLVQILWKILEINPWLFKKSSVVERYNSYQIPPKLTVCVEIVTERYFGVYSTPYRHVTASVAGAPHFLQCRPTTSIKLPP